IIDKRVFNRLGDLVFGTPGNFPSLTELRGRFGTHLRFEGKRRLQNGTVFFTIKHPEDDGAVVNVDIHLGRRASKKPIMWTGSNGHGLPEVAMNTNGSGTLDVLTPVFLIAQAPPISGAGKRLSIKTKRTMPLIEYLLEVSESENRGSNGCVTPYRYALDRMPEVWQEGRDEVEAIASAWQRVLKQREAEELARQIKKQKAQDRLNAANRRKRGLARARKTRGSMVLLKKQQKGAEAARAYQERHRAKALKEAGERLRLVELLREGVDHRSAGRVEACQWALDIARDIKSELLDETQRVALAKRMLELEQRVMGDGQEIDVAPAFEDDGEDLEEALLKLEPDVFEDDTEFASSPVTKQKTKRTRTWATNQFPMQPWEENYDKVLAQTLHIPGGIVETIGTIGAVSKRRRALASRHISIVDTNGNVPFVEETDYYELDGNTLIEAAGRLEGEMSRLFKKHAMLILEGPRTNKRGRLKLLNGYLGGYLGTFSGYGESRLRLFFSKMEGVEKPVLRAVSLCVFNGGEDPEPEIMIEKYTSGGKLCGVFRMQGVITNSVVQIYRDVHTGFVAGVRTLHDGSFHHEGPNLEKYLYTPFEDSVVLGWLDSGSFIRAVALDGIVKDKSILELAFDGFIRIEYKTKADLKNSESGWRLFGTVSRKKEGVAGLFVEPTLRDFRKREAVRIRIRHLPVRTNKQREKIISFCGEHPVSDEIPVGSLLEAEFDIGGEKLSLQNAKVVAVPEDSPIQPGVPVS
ncbi:hypothetical protein ACFL96_20205, partial [Thermoproteota archaeon]